MEAGGRIELPNTGFAVFWRSYLEKSTKALKGIFLRYMELYSTSDAIPLILLISAFFSAQLHRNYTEIESDVSRLTAKHGPSASYISLLFLRGFGFADFAFQLLQLFKAVFKMHFHRAFFLKLAPLELIKLGIGSGNGILMRDFSRMS